MENTYRQTSEKANALLTEAGNMLFKYERVRENTGSFVLIEKSYELLKESLTIVKTWTEENGSREESFYLLRMYPMLKGASYDSNKLLHLNLLDFLKYLDEKYKRDSLEVLEKEMAFEQKVLQQEMETDSSQGIVKANSFGEPSGNERKARIMQLIREIKEYGQKSTEARKELDKLLREEVINGS